MRVILVGGFLGSGKTTLLAEAARRLRERNLRVGLITNDQAPALVDTALLEAEGVEVREVAGSCFCCNFGALRAAVESLEHAGADCVIAEPVGSCTDLSATIVQPLKIHAPGWHVAPLSVLIDPMRIRSVLQASQCRLHPDAAYILRLQLQEADQILLTKTDTVSEGECEALLESLAGEFPDSPIAPISVHTGTGVAEWLERVLGDQPSGRTIATVDYDRYAHGEAVLGWLNATAGLRWIDGLQPAWRRFVAAFMARVQEELQECGHEVGHVKLLLVCPRGSIAANVTNLEVAPILCEKGSLDRLTARITVNARVQASPEETARLFSAALQAVARARVAVTMEAFHCLSPGRPVPTYRHDSVVG